MALDVARAGHLTNTEPLRYHLGMKNKAAVELGRLGGRVKSPAKTEAARRNARKGGRPKRQPSSERTDR